MNILENSKIYQLQTDYVNGIGEHGAVHKKYSEIMEQYKRAYVQCPIFEATGLMDLYMDKDGSLKNGVIADMVLIALSVFALNGRIMWCVIAFIAAIVKFWQAEMEQPSEDNAYNDLHEYLGNYMPTLSTFTEKSGRWFILPIVVISFVFIISAVGANINLMWLVYSTPLIIDLYKRMNVWKIAPKKAYAANKESVVKMQQAEAGLEEIRNQLRLLIPELQKEYREELNQAVNGMTASERQSVIRQYGIFPERFWWEVNPSQILEKQMYQDSIRESFMTSHEVAAIGRTLGKEFKNAGINYAPMYTEQLTEKEMNQIYQQNIQLVRNSGGVVLDFADCIKYASMVTESEMVKDYDYAENSLARAYKTDEWNSLGTDLNEAHRDGVLTDGEYRDLRNRYNNLNSDVRGHINRKIEVGEHVETFNKFRIFVRYEWTGQALLLPDANIPGGYVLLDYRCRPEYEFENLEELKKSLPVTQILADYASGQQDLIANVQRMIMQRNVAGRAERTIQKMNTAQVLGIISIALISFFTVPVAPIVGIILGVISRKKGGGKLAIIGIIINIFGLVGQVLALYVIKALLTFH